MNSKRFTLLAIVLLAAAGVGWTLTSGDTSAASDASGELAAAPVPGFDATNVPDAYLAETSEDGSHLERILVFKSPTCGCCSLWIEHLEKNGFEVEARDNPAMTPVKQDLGVPSALVSCHTAIVAGRIVEGHVPADVVQDFLADEEAYERWVGIAVPGMPVGSPGMEVPGRAADSYDVIAFDRDGNTAVFASR